MAARVDELLVVLEETFEAVLVLNGNCVFLAASPVVLLYPTSLDIVVLTPTPPAPFPFPFALAKVDLPKSEWYELLLWEYIGTTGALRSR